MVPLSFHDIIGTRDERSRSVKLTGVCSDCDMPVTACMDVRADTHFDAQRALAQCHECFVRRARVMSAIFYVPDYTD